VALLIGNPRGDELVSNLVNFLPPVAILKHNIREKGQT
jgi:hypothetical protein